LRAVIFANGQLNHSISLQSEDFIIAANGGVHHCLRLGLHPQVVIGDLDSLDQGILSALKSKAIQIIQYPERKDHADLELAIRYAHEIGASDILIIAALGQRWDQTVANILLPAAYASLPIQILDGAQEIYFIRPGEPLQVVGQPGDTLSLIPLAGDVFGVTTSNLEYPLSNDTLKFGSTLGISNALVSRKATIFVESGLLLCVVIHSSNNA